MKPNRIAPDRWNHKPVAFISCDWGTSRFRLVWVREGRPVRSLQSPQGVGVLSQRRDFPRVLADGLRRLRAPAGLPVVISGMASSSIGWRELPYAQLPFSLTGCDAVWAEVQPNVFLISGVASDEDIMRGEETQLLGLPVSGEALVILPGTHSKHARVRGGKLVGFQTFMTGELFAATAGHTVLARSVAAHAPFDRRAFVAGVETAQQLPVAAALFRVRGRDVLQGVDRAANRSFLSGVWVGAELAGLPARVPVWVCATAALAPAYATALRVLGRRARIVPAPQVEALARRGQAVLLQRILEAES
jgi:2-dehydro-3-deoxygalactonokinase